MYLVLYSISLDMYEVELTNKVIEKNLKARLKGGWENDFKIVAVFDSYGEANVWIQGEIKHLQKLGY